MTTCFNLVWRIDLITKVSYLVFILAMHINSINRHLIRAHRRTVQRGGTLRLVLPVNTLRISGLNRIKNFV